jgi:Putative Flp pilus-assembly TadE/G-like
MKLIQFRKGQMAIVMTLAMATLLGVMALGADVGVMYYNWNQLQKGADAAAVAGANYLNTNITLAAAKVDANCTGQPDAAKKAACTYAINNGLATDANSLVMNEPNPNLPGTNLQVIVNRSGIPYTFGRVIGLNTYKVAAAATAAIKPAGSAHVFPIGIQCNPAGTPFTCSTPASKNTDMMLTEKVQTSSGGTVFSPGNWSWIGPDGSNTQSTAGDIAKGSTTLISFGGTVPSNTGNFQNSKQIGDAFNTLVTQHNTVTNSWPQSCANVTYAQVCNSSPPTAPCPGDPLAVVVPLTNFNGVNGNKDLPVYGFAEIYLNAANNPTTSGSLQGCFITTVDPKTVAGGNAPNNGVNAPPTLVQ